MNLTQALEVWGVVSAAALSGVAGAAVGRRATRPAPVRAAPPPWLPPEPATHAAQDDLLPVEKVAETVHAVIASAAAVAPAAPTGDTYEIVNGETGEPLDPPKFLHFVPDPITAHRLVEEMSRIDGKTYGARKCDMQTATLAEKEDTHGAG